MLNGLITTLDTFLRNLHTVKSNQRSSSDAKRVSIKAIEDYRRILLELGSTSMRNIKPMLAAKQHACQSLRYWTALDYASYNVPSECLMSKFLHSHGIRYSEKEEFERISHWFPKVYQKYGETKRIYEMTHPVHPSIDEQTDSTVYKYLENLTNCCNNMHDYIKRIHTDLFSSNDETEEILLKLAMKIWKAVRCLRMVASTSPNNILEIFGYQVGNTSKVNDTVYDNDDQWPASLCLRGLPIIQTITAGIIVIVGLLKISTPMTRILLTPDVIATERAFVLLDQYHTSISTF